MDIKIKANPDKTGGVKNPLPINLLTIKIPIKNIQIIKANSTKLNNVVIVNSILHFFKEKTTLWYNGVKYFP